MLYNDIYFYTLLNFMIGYIILNCIYIIINVLDTPPQI